MSSFQLDILNEIGNIGAGNAATSLSMLMGRKVDMALPWTRFCSIEEGCAELSHFGQIGVGIEVGVEGAIEGLMLLTLDEQSALQLIEAFGEMLRGMGLDNELAQSALMEVGNIVTGSFLTAISNFLGVTATSTPPLFTHDYFDAFVCNIVVEGCRGVDGLFVFKTELKVDDRAVTGDLAFLPTPNSFALIMNKILSSGGMSNG